VFVVWDPEVKFKAVAGGLGLTLVKEGEGRSIMSWNSNAEVVVAGAAAFGRCREEMRLMSFQMSSIDSPATSHGSNGGDSLRFKQLDDQHVQIHIEIEREKGSEKETVLCSNLTLFLVL
jgi:hypothetical protein